MVKNPPANAGDREDTQEKEMAMHSSNLAWEIPWTEEPSGLQSIGSQKKLDKTEQLNNSSKGPTFRRPI